ncbi:hypothetical protein ScPMuIL_001241 [Solemya velum]
MLRGDKEQLEVQVNRLQHKVKDLGEDYRTRLIKYVEDISEFVDKGNGVPDPNGVRDTRMREYVDRMITGKGKRNMANKYESLLVSYRNLRQLCEQRGFEDTDMGPDEHELVMSDAEIQAAQQRENNRLRTQINKLKSDLAAIRAKVCLG